MTATHWAKFFWSDWLADVNLRRCSPAARGLWMDMLCIAAQSETPGVLAHKGAALAADDIARIAGMAPEEAAALVAELEAAGVFSRDRKGRIYSRRMVRDVKKVKHAREIGRKGGLASLCTEKGIFARSGGRSSGAGDDPPGPISQKPETRSQAPEAGGAGRARGANGPAGALVARAAAAMRVAPEALLRKPAWIVFGDMMAGWEEEGCDAARDVWPTIERLAARLRAPPASPAYFRAAVIEARDERLARGGPHASGSAQEWADRLAVFAAEGAWSRAWGPRPGEAGCLAPEHGKQKTGIGGTEDRERKTGIGT